MRNEVAIPARRFVALWLFSIAVLIFMIVVLGGLTRLTGSGLSMVDWRPLMGILPPLNEAEWLAVFADYQLYPEFQIYKPDMLLDEFKFLFYMEYFHRTLGRLIGIVFLLPFIVFLYKRCLSGRAIRRLSFLFFLGGMQGVVGWYMVKSGLVDIPRVSQYRLVLHLSMAILVFSLSLWYAFDLTVSPALADCEVLASLRGKLLGIIGILASQIISGGFVAGLKAGMIFNTWPTMDGRFIPQGLWNISPPHANFFENPVMVQFVHRNLALVVAICILYLFVRIRKRLTVTRNRVAWHMMAFCVVLQVSLGIGTLLERVPTSMASGHQTLALILWTLVLFICQQAHAAHGERNQDSTRAT